MKMLSFAQENGIVCMETSHTTGLGEEEPGEGMMWVRAEEGIMRDKEEGCKESRKYKWGRRQKQQKGKNI